MDDMYDAKLSVISNQTAVYKRFLRPMIQNVFERIKSVDLGDGPSFFEHPSSWTGTIQSRTKHSAK